MKKLLAFFAAAIILWLLVFIAPNHSIYQQICNQAKDAANENCAAYDVFLVIFRIIGKFLDDHDGAFTAIATVAVAIFTFTLWRAGEKQLTISKKLADIAGKQVSIQEAQTEISRQQFLATHRPRIIMRNVYMTDVAEQLAIHYTLVNTGGSDATIVNSRFYAESIPQYIFMRDADCSDHSELGEIILVAGDGRAFEYQIPDVDSAIWNITAFYNDSINTLICFVGSVRYTDSFGNIRTSVFRRRFDGSGFCKTDNPDHEYTD